MPYPKSRLDSTEWFLYENVINEIDWVYYGITIFIQYISSAWLIAPITTVTSAMDIVVLLMNSINPIPYWGVIEIASLKHHGALMYR